MEHTRTSRAEAERLIRIAEKLLHNKDFNGSRDFAVLAQETEPLLDGPEQILGVADVLLAADKRVNNHPDWYSILQIERRSDDFELIKRQYRRLALLLHPDKNKFDYADSAFKLVADAWAVLSDPTKKSFHDNELSLFSRVDLVPGKQKQFYQQQQQHNQQKLPVRRSGAGVNTSSGGTTRLMSFWTVCPYCYNLYEYGRVYEGCCLRCQNCKRAFTAAEISSMPPFVPGKEAYYCCWVFCPMGFVASGSDIGKNGTFSASVTPNGVAVETEDRFVDLEEGNDTQVPAPPPVPVPAPAQSRKRGRPRKNP